MKTIWKNILTATVILPGAGTAFAQNQPLTCWYDDHADFTSADSAPAGATIGSVVKAKSGDKAYSYTISARDGTACPVQLPLSTKTALTVALVRQDDGSCTNDNVADTGTAVLAGSATVSPETSTTSTAAIRLAGTLPNTSYHVYLKCFRQLGIIRTDAPATPGEPSNFQPTRLDRSSPSKFLRKGRRRAPSCRACLLKSKIMRLATPWPRRLFRDGISSETSGILPGAAGKPQFRLLGASRNQDLPSLEVWQVLCSALANNFGNEINWFNSPDTFPPDLTIGPRSPILARFRFGQALALGLPARAPELLFFRGMRA